MQFQIGGVCDLGRSLVVWYLPKTSQPPPTHCRHESPLPTVLPPPQAPDLAIDLDVRPAPFTIPPTPSPAPALTLLTPSPSMLHGQLAR